jgi:hypothetical protein
LRWLATSLALLSLCEAVIAEPYLAVSKGMHCSSCHSNPAGGGKRNVYGNVFAQAELPAQRIGDPTAKLWTGEVFTWLSVGGNLRADYESVELPNASSDAKFDLNRGTVYLEASVIPNRLSVHVDQQFTLDSTENRELLVRLKTADGKFHVAAGQFILPYGLRLQDDSAFIRQATGVNFNIPDRGRPVRLRIGAVGDADFRYQWFGYGFGIRVRRSDQFCGQLRAAAMAGRRKPQYE